MPSMDSGKSDLKDNLRSYSDTDDELSVPAQRTRITQGSSLAGGPSSTIPKLTPHGELRQLAAIIRKPSTPRRRRASVDAPLSLCHISTSDPNRLRTPNIRQPLQPTVVNRSNPTTPHAIKAMQQRRATPGRDRRKSERLQRETPRDVLRNLSKVLAPISQPIKPSPLSSQPQSDKPKQAPDDDFENDQDLAQPIFSIAIDGGVGEDDSFQEAPPRLSMPLEDGNQTGRSTEIARQATNEQSLDRLFRGSFGSVRASDRFGNITDLGYDDASQRGINHGTGQPGIDEDVDELGNYGEHSDIGGNTEDLRRAIFEGSDQWRSLADAKQRARQLDPDAFSPFVLNIPDFDLAATSYLAGSLDKPSFQNDDEPLEVIEQEGRGILDDTNSGLHKPVMLRKTRNRAQRTLKRSRYGIPYSGLPIGVTKKVVSTSVCALATKEATINKEGLTAIVDASDRYFEQLSEDLGAFAYHAGRKRIDERDMIAVMTRQRKVSATATPFFLAQKYLPGEQLQAMRVSLPNARPREKRRCFEAIEADDEDNDL